MPIHVIGNVLYIKQIAEKYKQAILINVAIYKCGLQIGLN
jgi:hypothetical protein